MRVTLAGKPNVGKSSLLNALLQEDRAIVTAYAGTTRDTLEERARIKDIHIIITDSAGLRDNPEVIEEESNSIAAELIDSSILSPIKLPFGFEDAPLKNNSLTIPYGLDFAPPFRKN